MPGNSFRVMGLWGICLVPRICAYGGDGGILGFAGSGGFGLAAEKIEVHGKKKEVHKL